METRFGTGISSGSEGESYEVAKDASKNAVDELGVDRVDFCQVFSSSKYNYSEVIEGVRDVVGDAELIGCSTSGEFTSRSVKNEGIAVAAVTSDKMKFFTSLGTGLSESVTGAVRETVNQLPSTVEGYPHLSAINLHDGLAGVGEQLALTTQRKLGQNVSFAGGSAGDNFEMESTHVFVGDRIEEDAVALALIASKTPLFITVGHGHKPLSEPLEVTESEGNVVYELDGRPAFEVFKDEIRESAKEEFGIDVDELQDGSDELSKLLTRYEFGIDQGKRYKIRWPGITTTTAGPIEFAVEVPEGTVFRVMYSPRQEQIDSAADVMNSAIQKTCDGSAAGAFVYDCICRATILGDDFSEAVEEMAQTTDIPFAGFETYGEISMQMGEMSGYHNTTTVVMVLPK